VRIAFEKDRVAQRNRGRDGAHREDHREVPGGDHPDHPDRQPLRDAETALLVGEHLTDGLGGQRRGGAQLLLRLADLEGGLLGNAASLVYEPPLALLARALERVGGGLE
jgi:hypothetical protein